jgi:hypothetical protein
MPVRFRPRAFRYLARFARQGGDRVVTIALLVRRNGEPEPAPTVQPINGPRYVMGTMVDLSGQVFSRLTVVRRAERSSDAGALWLCRCQCGNQAVAASLKLRRGLARSCGCLRLEIMADQRTTHGKSRTDPRTYRSWKEMRQRCRNPRSDNFQWYGGRGIQVCQQWESFERFLADMGARPQGATLDRIDNDGNYEPGNCRWATQKEQTRKQSTTKLTEPLVAQLRADRAQLGLSYAKLGAKYGISATTAQRCVAGITWS